MIYTLQIIYKLSDNLNNYHNTFMAVKSTLFTKFSTIKIQA